MLASGVAFVLFGGLLIPIAKSLGQLGNEPIVGVLVLLVTLAAPSAVMLYAFTLGLGDLALRSFKVGGKLPYALLGLLAPILVAVGLRVAAQGHSIAVWEYALIGPAGLLGGHILGLHRPVLR